MAETRNKLEKTGIAKLEAWSSKFYAKSDKRLIWTTELVKDEDGFITVCKEGLNIISTSNINCDGSDCNRNNEPGR